MTPLTYRPSRDDAADRSAFVTLERTGFGTTDEDTERWMAAIGPEEIRFVDAGDVTAAMGSWIEIGHSVGGRTIPAGGITAVSVGHAHRGGGIGRYLLSQMLAEAGQRGWPLVSLYASTFAFYRKVGFEIAGWSHRYKAPTAALTIPRHPDDGTLRPVPIATPPFSVAPPDPALIARLAPLHAGRSGQRPGLTAAAGRFLWWRRLQAMGRGLDGVVFDGPDGAEAYCMVDCRAAAQTIGVAGWAATTARGLRAVARWLAGFRSSYDWVTWPDAPHSPLTLLLPDRGCEVENVEPVLYRVVDPAALLARRGYGAGTGGAVAIALEDADLPDNSGRYGVRVTHGEATTVTRLAADESADLPQVVVGPRGFVALVTGATPAGTLALTGLLDGTPEAIAAAEGLFAGPLPGTPDRW